MAAQIYFGDYMLNKRGWRASAVTVIAGLLLGSVAGVMNAAPASAADAVGCGTNSAFGAINGHWASTSLASGGFLADHERTPSTTGGAGDTANDYPTNGGYTGDQDMMGFGYSGAANVPTMQYYSPGSGGTGCFVYFRIRLQASAAQTAGISNNQYQMAIGSAASGVIAWTGLNGGGQNKTTQIFFSDPTHNGSQAAPFLYSSTQAFTGNGVSLDIQADTTTAADRASDAGYWIAWRIPYSTISTLLPAALAAGTAVLGGTSQANSYGAWNKDCSDLKDSHGNSLDTCAPNAGIFAYLAGTNLSQPTAPSMSLSGGQGGTQSGAAIAETVTAGTPIRGETPTVLNSGVSNYSLTGSLPTGVTFNPTTGVISGTPTLPQTAVTYTVTANLVGGGSLSSTYTLTVNPMRYTLTLTTPTNGSYTGDPAGTYDSGTVINETATAAVDYHFHAWSCTPGGVTTSETLTLTMTSNVTCVASFGSNAAVSYLLTLTAPTHGSVAGTAPGPWDSGTAVTETATADPGYHFDAWTCVPAVATSGAVIDFTLTSDETCTATFAVNTHTLSFDANGGTWASAVLTETSTVAYGTDVIAVQPGTNPTRPGYTFVGWSLTGTGPKLTAYSMPDADLTLKAIWAIQTYTVIANTGGTGSGSVSPSGSSTVDSGTVVVETATANAGSSFAGWSCTPLLTGVDTSTNVLTFTASSDETCTATFTLNSYTVTFNANLGAGSMANQVGTAPVALTANAFTRTGFTFAGWNTLAGGGGTAYANGAVYPFNASVTLYAQWTPITFVLTTGVTGSGSVTPTTGPQGFGAVVNITATPASGWSFAGWSGDCVGMPNPAVVTMNAAKSCTANFSQNPVYVPFVVTIIGSGTVTPVSGDYLPGITINPVATPAAGWVFVGWSGDCTGTTCSVTLNTLRRVTATFQLAAPTPPVTPPVTPTPPAPPAPIVVPPATETIATDPGHVTIPGAPNDGSLIVSPTLLPKAPGLASATLTNGVLGFTAKPGFSGKTSIPLEQTINGKVTVIMVPVTVSPEAPKTGAYTPTDPKKTVLNWEPSPNAISYDVWLNGKLVCKAVAAPSCPVAQLLGPNNKIEVIANGNDGTTSKKTLPGYAPERFIPVAEVHFAVNSYLLDAAAIKILDTFVAMAKRQGFPLVQVIAHTDGQGGTKNALHLSQQRAVATAKYLAKFLTVTISKIAGAEKAPVASNKTKAGQAKNRRAVVAVK